MNLPTSTQTQNPIFHKPDGSQLAIFAQADGNANRMKLARRLRTGGAATCTNPKLADIILVNPSHTEEETGILSAQAIIDAWADSKVILDYQWVKQCLDEGRLLLEQDNWGGFLVQPNGDAPSDEDDAERALPTPRPSPDSLQHSAQNTEQPTTSYSPGGSTTLRTSPVAFQPNMTSQPTQNGMPMAATMQQQMFSVAEAAMGNGAIPAAFTPEMWMSICDVMSQSDEPGLQVLAGHLRGLGPSGSVPSGSTAIPPPTTSRHSSVYSQSEPPGMSASPSRTTSEEPRASGKGKANATREKKCFLKNGKPIEFFVQVDHVHRREIIAIIKAEGGSILKDVEKVDIAVLYSAAAAGTPIAREYAALYKAASSAGVPCVGAQFVRDCQTKRRLLDWHSYASKDPEKKRKKSIDVRRPPPPDVESEDEEPDVPLAKKPKEAIVVKTHKARPKAEPKPPPKVQPAPSPTVSQRVKTAPIPPQQPKGRRGPATTFTESEYQRARDIALEMYSEDPEASQSAVAGRLYKEMPTHSEGSWKTTMFFRLKSQMDEANRKGRIQYNKRKRQEGKTSEGRTSVGASNAAGGSGTPIEPVPPTPSHEELEERDIDDIVNFFVNGEDEEFGDGEERDQNRDAIFGKLDKRVPCRTEVNWNVFYGKHFQRVQKLVEEADTMQT
ncbi:hypothetical protein BKA70DRAFT_336665 [Coprinopsis sp. MPI-PUGE-AT-0042]|nr:hypothetical protein BKA70DRAFT_336665 [Coprinopsis sp. MPI-PUGE-AT-0042]